MFEKITIIAAIIMIISVGIWAWIKFNSSGEILTGTTMNNNQLKIEELAVGSGETAKVGDLLTVHYVGSLENGAKFDSSYDRGQPFEFTLGAGQVIPGWDLGVKGMKVGGKRKLTISPELAYGEKDLGVIPPNSTLVFEVELLGIK